MQFARDVEDGKLLPQQVLFIKKQTISLKALFPPLFAWKMPQET